MTYRYNTMHDLAYVESKRIMLINQVGGSTEIVYDGTSAVVECRRADRTADEEFRGGFRDLRHAGRARTDRSALYHLQGSYPHGLFGRGLRSARLFREERLCEGRHRPFGRHRLGGGRLSGRRCAGARKRQGAVDAVAVFVRPLGGRRARAGRQSGESLSTWFRLRRLTRPSSIR